MNKIEVYAKNWCPYCVMAKSLLKDENLDFKEIDVTYDSDLEYEMSQRSGRFTVPQIFINERPVGGFDDLAKLRSSGLLTQLSSDIG